MTPNAQDHLAALKDIHLPAEPHWWPPALGWWIIFILLIVALFFAIRTLVIRRRQSQFKKQALTVLKQIEKNTQSGSPERLVEISQWLRLVVLSLFERRVVAAMNGQKWLTFLDQIGNTSGFTYGAGAVLADHQYQNKNYPHDDKLMQLLVRWLKQLPLQKIPPSALTPLNKKVAS